MPLIASTLDEALAPITDGCVLLVPRESSGVPMAATRALIRRGVRRLTLVTCPTSTLQADLLIGAGCVETLETSAVSLNEFGAAPRFTAAAKSGAIRLKDTTCPALHAALQATEKGVPFMPLRGLIGSDVLAERPDWRVIDNPFGSDDPIVLIPALKGDVALFHAPMADRDGNVFIGTNRDLVSMAHAADEDDRDRGGDARRQSARRSAAGCRHPAGLLCRERRGGAARRLAAAARRPLPGGCRAPCRIRPARRDRRGLRAIPGAARA